ADPCDGERRSEQRAAVVDAGEKRAPSELAPTLSLHSVAGLSSLGTLRCKAQVEEQLAVEETPAATAMTVTVTEPQHPGRDEQKAPSTTVIIPLTKIAVAVRKVVSDPILPSPPTPATSAESPKVAILSVRNEEVRDEEPAADLELEEVNSRTTPIDGWKFKKKRQRREPLKEVTLEQNCRDPSLMIAEAISSCEIRSMWAEPNTSNNQRREAAGEQARQVFVSRANCANGAASHSLRGDVEREAGAEVDRRDSLLRTSFLAPQEQTTMRDRRGGSPAAPVTTTRPRQAESGTSAAGMIMRLLATSDFASHGGERQPRRPEAGSTPHRWLSCLSPGMQLVERTQWTSAASLVASSIDEVKPGMEEADSTPSRPLRGLTRGKEMKSERSTKKRTAASLTGNVKEKKPGPSGARCRQVRCSLPEKKAKDGSPTEGERKKKTPLLEDETRKDGGGVSSLSNPRSATLGRTEQQRKAWLGRKIWAGWPETQSEAGRTDLEQGWTIVGLGSDLLVHSNGPHHENNRIEPKLSLGPNNKGTHWVQKKTGLRCQSGPGPPIGFVLKWVSLEKKKASWNSLSGWSGMPTIEELLREPVRLDHRCRQRVHGIVVEPSPAGTSSLCCRR
ncbi:unnamed protein product, partial [Linum tenue]